MPKSLIVFYTDQQRRDSLGCYGNRIAHTPNIAGLARRGVLLQNHYAANPVCMPSRASFMTGRHPQAHRLLDNGIALPTTETTLPGVLKEQGYHTCSIGKIHLTPTLSPPELGFQESSALWQTGALDVWVGPYYGFEEVRLTIGHGDSAFIHGGHYGKWVLGNFKNLAQKTEEYRSYKITAFGRSTILLEAHYYTWVADQAIGFMRSIGDRPFFLYVSFPDPHHPFAVPDPFYTIHEGADFPAPRRREGENDHKPLHYRKAMSGESLSTDGGARRMIDMTHDDWRTVFTATYGMVSLIDHSVGRVLQCLLEKALDFQRRSPTRRICSWRQECRAKDCTCARQKRF